MKTIKAISIFLVVATFAIFPLTTLAIAPPLAQASYTYDANNRLTKVVYTNARTVNFTYDNNGNLTNVATDGGTAGIVLANGTALTGIVGSKDNNKLYNFDVIAGQTFLEVKISGGTGDCDLEVSNSSGTIKKYSMNPGNTETIRIILSNLAKETWRINLIYKTDVSGLSLIAKYYSGTPLAPAGLKATDGTFADKILLTWTESVGASSYLVYRNDTGTTSAGANNIAEVENTTFTDVGTPALPLDVTKTYTYFVKAKRATPESPFSTGDAGYITKIPAMPASVTASAGTYFDKIRVTWPITPNMASSTYNIYRLPVTEKAITAASAANPCVITAKDHGFTSGEKVVINGLPGTMGAKLNGYYYIITVIDANSFSIPEDTTGKAAATGGTANLLESFNKELSPIIASNPCVITSPSHPFVDGDTVLICGVTGTMGPLLNGKSFAVTVVDIDTFTVPVDTRLKTYISGGTATMTQIVKALPAQAGTTGSYDDLPDPLTLTHEPTTAHSYYYWVEVIGKTGSSPLKMCTAPGYLSKKGPATVTATAGTLLGKVRITWAAVAGATSYDVYRDINNTFSNNNPAVNVAGALLHDDTSAFQGTTYFYRVKAKYNAYYDSDYSPTVSGNHKIMPGPASITASAGTYMGKVHVAWTAVTGATSYDVYRDTVNTFSNNYAPTNVAGALLYDDASANQGTTYFYKVKAKDANGFFTNFSPVASGSYKATMPGSASITATAGTLFGKVRVSWASVVGATSYDVYRDTVNTFSNNIPPVNVVGALLHDDTSANQGTTYFYKVQAKDANGFTSSFSPTASGSHKLMPGPASITASVGTYYGKIRVTWSAVVGADSYELSRDGDIKTLASTTYDDVPGDTLTHNYIVKAKAGAWYSNPSIEAKGGRAGGAAATALAAPVLTASKDIYTTVKLSWTEIPMAKDYIIYRNTSNVFPASELIKVNAPVLTYDDTAARGVLYYYWIKSNNDTAPLKISPASAVVQGRALGTTTPIVSGGTATITGGKDSCVYYSIVVPPETTRLVATLTNTGTAVTNDCDLYLKLGSCPTTTSFNVKGTESLSGETAIASNPVAGTWYIMLYGVTDYGVFPSPTVTLKVDCYSVTDIILTQVPLNNQIVPFLTSFKGRVVDASGTGITGLNIKVRDPIYGTVSTLATKTDATGYFTYATTVNMEGEHTYDFFFDKFPETGSAAKGTASHTVSTRIGVSGLFDSSSYLPATPVALANLADTIGMQTFLNIRNGWDPVGPLDPAFEKMWVESTVINTPNDEAITSKGIDGLYIVFYGVEGAGAGNDTTATSNLSTVPLVLHVTPDAAGGDLTNILSNLVNWGMITGAKKDEVLAGGLGVVAITVIDPNVVSDLSLLPDDELSLISDFISNIGTSSQGTTAIYSGGTPTIFIVGTRRIVTAAY